MNQCVYYLLKIGKKLNLFTDIEEKEYDGK